jgi:hypothetical protein
VDLNYLKAFSSSKAGTTLRRLQTIDANARAKGWLIFATHDVCDQPTRFGCTPAFLNGLSSIPQNRARLCAGPRGLPAGSQTRTDLSCGTTENSPMF